MTEQDFFPWDDIAEGNIFESGIYLMEIASFEDGKASTGKRMPKARFNCIEPANCKGMSFFDQYVVGTDEEPTSVVAGTMGARSMKSVLKSAQVPKGNSLQELIANSVGNQLLVQLVKYEEPEGQYKGTLRNRVVGTFKLGEREVGITGDKGGKSPAPKTPPAPPAPPTVETLVCATCGKPVPKDEYSAHVENCTG